MNLKSLAKKYYEAVNSRDVGLIQSMVREDYIQHNPKVPTGRKAFLDLLPQLDEYQSTIENYRMFEDKNHIIMHHKWNNAEPFGAPVMAAFHIIRFDDGNKIAEHWSVMAQHNPEEPDEQAKLSGPQQVDLSWPRENTRSTVRRLVQTWVADLEEDSAHKYQAIHKVFAEGDFALAISEGHSLGSHSAMYDLFQLKNEKVVNQWSVHQKIPSDGLANNNGMFGFS